MICLQLLIVMGIVCEIQTINLIINSPLCYFLIVGLVVLAL